MRVTHKPTCLSRVLIVQKTKYTHVRARIHKYTRTHNHVIWHQELLDSGKVDANDVRPDVDFAKTLGKSALHLALENGDERCMAVKTFCLRCLYSVVQC